MNAPEPDETAIRSFITWLHKGAARAFRAAGIEPDQAGWMVVTRNNPIDASTQVYDYFRVGDVDAMTSAVLEIASHGMNPFVEGRTVDLARVEKGKRGDDEATAGVFALLIDRDHDDGKGGVALDVTPSALIASSADNRHEWLMLDRAAGITDAKTAGEALRRASQADSATGKPTQPFRCPGTVNYPGEKKKRTRGRVPVVMRTLDINDATFSLDAIVALTPEEEAGAQEENTQAAGDILTRMIAAAAAAVGDRSNWFFECCREAYRQHIGIDALETLFRAHPNGAASKYLRPVDRLSEEIHRIYKKLSPRQEARTGTRPFAWRDHATTAAGLQNTAFPPLREVIPGLLTEGLTLLAGKPKKGKTWLALDLATSIAIHRFCLGDLLPAQGDVLYIALEDNPRRLKRRLQHLLFRDDEWPHCLTFACLWRRLDDGGLDDMVEWISEHPEARLIVVDTLAAVRPQAREYGFVEDYSALAGLQRLAGLHQVAILVVHHLRKASADDFGDEISGTLGLTAAVDALLVLRSGDSDSGAAELCLRSRDIEEQKFGATFSRETCRWTLDKTSTQDRSRLRVLAVLTEADEPLTPAEIMRLTGLTRPAVDNQLMRLRKTEDVHRVGGQGGKYALGPAKPSYQA